MTEQQKITFPQLYQQLDGLMLRDKTRFARRLHGVKKVKNPESQQAILQEMALEISQAASKVLLREAARPAIIYPENLPVSQKKQEILEAVRDHQVVIVAGETGSGKTTQLPKICMELGRGLKRTHRPYPAASPGGADRRQSYCRRAAERAGRLHRL
ncbi:ATP-dependent helicase hrpA [Klebsiella pneumoniae]|nr:ATP-dependent helicase hrpA [Klebsiella pneumoniae]